MATDGLKQRHMPIPPPAGLPSADAPAAPSNHPGGAVKHGGVAQVMRMFLIAAYFFECTFSIALTQFLGIPLYFLNRDFYYAYMARTKESFGLLVTTMTQWWSPTVVRISGDASVRGQLRLRKDGRLECQFPERIVLIANHQLYSDWLYLWWISYTNGMHGHIYIILKESLKYVPLLGPGMLFYGFIFLARNWVKDEPRFRHRLRKLSTPAAHSPSLKPMWLLIFPEGTNMSSNGRAASAKWAEKQSMPDLHHSLLPRSTGLLYCLKELRETVGWLYDCTVAYEGIPRGEYGQDIFTLRSTYFQGRPPKSVNMYWRRFAISSIPLDDIKAFEQWLLARWREKDELLEMYVQNGRFPADDGIDASSGDGDGMGRIEVNSVKRGAGYIETEVKANWWEVSRIFVVLASFALLAIIMSRIWDWASRILAG
ncbi:MAG: hypothetical protein M1829_001756 [Trizodia sp. TS-e1964]|nr:MAG: hypothetical protein M1829_001756 [Trizodia sp. TS-e1964]